MKRAVAKYNPTKEEYELIDYTPSITYKVGDILDSTIPVPDGDPIPPGRVIVLIEPTGYVWRYETWEHHAPTPDGKVNSFYSVDSSDPFFEQTWKKRN